MIARIVRFRRQLLTFLVAGGAILSGYLLWHEDRISPWTRDGRVRADSVVVAPDVSGLVVSVDVRDNQEVRKGELLFRIDPRRFSLALSSARATLLDRHATMMEAIRDAGRYRELLKSGHASAERAENMEARAQEARARYEGAVARLASAQLDMVRSAVRARVNGYVTNLHLRPGDFIRRGEAGMALVDRDSFYVDGYFEETKLPSIRKGDRMKIRLMGVKTPLYGVVDSFSRGIFDFERSEAAGSVPRVNPTFSWVRLAQRIPVRIRLTSVPPDLLLVAGQTATVIDVDRRHGLLSRVAR